MVRRLYVPAKKGLLDEYDEELFRESVEGTVSSNDKYQELLRLAQENMNRHSMFFVSELYEKTDFPILDPTEVEAFVPYLLAQQDRVDYLGLFISKIVLDSYRSGNREFRMNLDNSNLDNLFHKVEELEEDLTINIKGSVGANFAADSDSLVVKGEVFGEGCGLIAAGVRIEARIFGEFTGKLAKNCYFKGDIFGKNTGRSNKTTYETSNVDTFRQLLQSVRMNTGNWVVLLDPYGDTAEEAYNVW
jgi:hypothetical protein